MIVIVIFLILSIASLAAYYISRRILGEKVRLFEIIALTFFAQFLACVISFVESDI